MAHIDGVERDVQLWSDPAGDWVAIYIDGVLHSVGDEGPRVEALLRLLGVKEVQDGAFLRGTGNKAAGTLAEIESWQGERARELELARSLRAEANAKIAEAAKIEAHYR